MNKKRHGILFNEQQLGPYPMEKIPRVDKPTTEFYAVPEPRRADLTVETLIDDPKYGPKVGPGKAEFADKEPVFRAFMDVNMLLSSWEMNPVNPVKSDLPKDQTVLTRHIKKLCHFCGADLVGICEVTPDAVYTHDDFGNPIECGYKYAIVFGVRKQRDTIAASYGCEWIDDAVSMQAYQRTGCIANTVTSYIRRMGWEAEPSIVPRYKTLMSKLVLYAGLGEASRLGIMVNPFLGAIAKYGTVLTNLPLDTDKPIDFGLQDYCEHCSICAENCCSNAVPRGDKIDYNGAHTWILKAENCAIFNRTNPVGKVCERCTKVCPWNNIDNDPKRFADWDGDIKKLHAMANEQAAFLKEHNYIFPEEADQKWWLPLRYSSEDGAYHNTREFDYKRHERKMAFNEKYLNKKK